MKLARRPFKRTLLSSLAFRDTISQFDAPELKAFTQVALATQDSTNRSIFLHNLTLISALVPKFKMLYCEFRNPLLMLDSIKISVRRTLQSWVHKEVGQHGVVYMFRFQFLATSSKSCLDILQNGTAWGRKPLISIR